MTDFQEEWKFLKEIKHGPKHTQGIYEVSNLGRVKLNGNIYQCKPYTNGYYYLGSSKTSNLLHRIVAEKFLPDWDPTKQVDHINTLKEDNRVSNLRMVTPKENSNNPLTIKHNSEGQTRNTGKYVWVNNKIIQKKVLKENLNEYLDNGYKLGRLEIKRNEKGQFSW